MLFRLILCNFLLLLSACSIFNVESDEIPYQILSKRIYDYWILDGRLSVTGQKDSWQANINWQHSPTKDDLKLSGPLGQGATIIQLHKNTVTINRGDGKIQSSNEPESFINRQLGIFVPIRSLTYWVVGLPDPTNSSLKINGGFEQAGWLVEYKPTQFAENNTLPRKITVTNKQVKLKLIVDQWDLNEKQ